MAGVAFREVTKGAAALGPHGSRSPTQPGRTQGSSSVEVKDVCSSQQPTGKELGTRGSEKGHGVRGPSWGRHFT